MAGSLESIGWRAKPVKLDPRWAAVKDARLGHIFPSPARMQEVHDFARSSIKYQPDTQDQWADPKTTLSRGYGDCEDICILERALLLNAGYHDRDIELMLVKDLNTQQKHALLWVKQHYLDNRSEKVLHITDFKDYWPYQCHNSKGSFVYGKIQ